MLLEPSTLAEYPRVRSLLNQKINASYYFQMILASHRFEDELFAKVEVAIRQLEECGQKVTRKAIGQRVGVKSGKFVQWPRVRGLIDQYLGISKQSQLIRFQQREDLLLVKVEQAIHHLEQLDKPVTHIALSQIIGVSAQYFKTYPRVKTLIESKVGEYHSYSIRQAEERETKLLERASSAIEQLKSNGLPITRTAVCEIIGKRSRHLVAYPQVKTLLDQETSRTPTKRILHPTGEDELIWNVNKAIEELEASEVLVTKTVVAKMLKVPPTVLRHNEHIMDLFKQVAEKQKERREEVFLAQVNDIVQELLKLDMPVTRIAISKNIQLSPSMINYYPSVASYIKKVTDEDKQKRLTLQFDARERELEYHVLEAIQQLRQIEQVVTVNAIARIVNMQPSALKRYPRVKAILESVVFNFIKIGQK